MGDTVLIGPNTRKLLCLILIFAVFSSLFFFVPEAKASFTTAKIMPLGDSITVGYPGLDGYRKSLYLNLFNSGFNVNFVGSQNNGTGLDNDNEGHLSYEANQIRDNVIGWLNNNPADIILLHIGTNDIESGQNAPAIVDEVASILDNIKSVNSQATVVLAKIILRGDNPSWNATTKTFDDALQAMAQVRIANGDKIVVADMENALNYSTDMSSDGIHLNLAGYEKMAGVWYDALVKILGYSLTINTVGHGLVTSLPDFRMYPFGAVVNLTANADDGWVFTSWSGDLIGSINSENITMNSNKTVTATFNQVYKLTITTNYGTTTPSAAEYWYTAGTNVTIAASPPTTGTNERFSWLNWTGSGISSYSGTNNTIVITMNGSITENAFWTHEYKLTLSSTSGTTTPSEGQHWYEAGTPVIITASPPDSADTRATWIGWIGSGTNSYTGTINPITVIMNGPINQVASWNTEYKLTVITDLGTSQPPAGESWYPAGTTINAEASSPTTQAGTQFICTGWTGTGSVLTSGTTTSSRFTLNAPSSITWTWKTQYYLTVNSAYGVPGGTGWYDAGSTAYATISPLTVSHYTFTGWSDGASGSSSTSNSILMENPKTATANWSPIQTSTPSPKPTPSSTAKPTSTPTPEPTPYPSKTVSPSASSFPSGSPSPSPSSLSDSNYMPLYIFISVGLISAGIFYLAVRKVSARCRTH
jgi:uncharacterized repeat protein (TIGR02543 family)